VDATANLNLTPRAEAPHSAAMRFVAAGLLGLVVPGAGHVLLGRRRAALLFAIPFLALVAAALGLYLSVGGIGVLEFLVTPGVLPALALVNLALAGWRLAAAFDATRGTARPATTLGIVGTGALVLVLAPHAWAGITISATNDFLDSVFAPDQTPAPGATAEPEPTDEMPPLGFGDEDFPVHDPFAWIQDKPEPTPAPTKAPQGPFTAGTGTLPGLGAAVPWDRPGAIPWGNDGRFDLLLLGSDAGPDRWSRRMDTMLLVEVDVATGKVAMVGLPRNLYNAPFPPGSPAYNAVKCGCFQDLLNAMYVEATVRHPSRWPGTGAVKGIGAVRSMVMTLTGRPVDAVLVADLWGVIKVVDAMGGIDIDIPYGVSDQNYPDPIYGHIAMSLKAGRQHLDGRHALFYARSRHQDSDYGRMQRQQILLEAIRDDIGPSTILHAPSLLSAAKGFAWTDLPRSSLPNLVDLFSRAASASVKNLRIVPPTYPSWLTPAEVTKIQKDVAKLLGVPAPTPSPSPSPSPGATPLPTPSPSPAGTDAPIPSPSPPPATESPPPPSASP
jgi:LCP family protein required for cell wall assembly